MAVTKQIYTASATWTASTLADRFRSAFIDSGLMSDWFDSFTSSGIENRILQIVYDNTKTYGTTYYWFMFTTGGVFLSTALGWNATTHAPTGTQYLDYWSTASNATTNHRQFISLATTTDVLITRYTSGINSGCTWFFVKNGTTVNRLFIPTQSLGPSSMIDLDKMAFNGTLHTYSSSGNNFSTITFSHGMATWIRRVFLATEAARGNTSPATTWREINGFSYGALGNISTASSNNNLNGFGSGAAPDAIRLPTAASNTQTGLASDYRPVFTGPLLSPYLQAMPADFGLASYYASNLPADQDTFVVSAGTEEWEIIVFSGNSSTTDGTSRLMFLARTV